MKKVLLLIVLLSISFCLKAQINYIGQYVDERWLDSEFGNRYAVTAGQFDAETGYLISGKVSVGNMELNTSRNGRCDMINIEESIAIPNRIQENAERFFSDNRCTNVNRSVHDGINGDLTYKLSYEAERIIGRRVILVTAKAIGSYNSFGTYFPTFYRKSIISSGL